MLSPKPPVEKSTKKKRSFFNKLGRAFVWVLASLLVLVILVIILIQVPAVQNFARKKVVTFLENKLHTKVAIGKLDIDFPTTLSLENVFFEDQSKDTLLYGGALKVNLKDVSFVKK